MVQPKRSLHIFNLPAWTRRLEEATRQVENQPQSLLGMPAPAPTRAPAAVAAFLIAALSGCDRGPRVVVYTSVDDAFAKPVFQAFTAETGIAVEPVFDAEAAKTTGLYHRLPAERDPPAADVFWNSEVARTARLAAAGVLLPYAPTPAAGIPAALRAPTWTGFAARARILIYNRARVPASDRPRSIRDLADPRFRGEAAIAEPLF